MEGESSSLLAEQLSHTIDLLKADNAALKMELEHLRELADRRLAALETCQKDHEERLRTVAEGVTQFKVWSGLASGASSVISLLAFLRTVIGV